jgi:hypothetical protein
MDPESEEMNPRYPDLQVSLRTENPLALVSATRLALRRAGKDRGEIEQFTQTALSSPDPRGACSRYVRLERRVRVET